MRSRWLRAHDPSRGLEELALAAPRPVRRTGLEIARLTGQLRGAGFRVAPSSANFLFIDTDRRSDQVTQELHRAGIIVKAWREPGYENFIRASLSTPEDNDFFVRCLAETCAKGRQ